MNETYKCFLIEPILGPPFIESAERDNHWPPFNYITGWRRVDTKEEKTHQRDFGVGAMWFATWYPKNWEWENETEPHLIVCCPNGDTMRDWDIDARCNNCGSPKDKLHRCWVRSGTPPFITVNKGGDKAQMVAKNVTCDAGAGSILLPKWHGYLKNGVLTP